MSPRRRNPDMRVRLLDSAARVLLTEGPQALSTRRIAADAGCSTMALYTNFGGMGGLVREMVHEGFARLDRSFSQIRETADPVADMWLFGWMYRHSAWQFPHLYGVMFGAASLSDFSLEGCDRQHGRYVLGHVTRCAGRCVRSGRFAEKEAELVAHLMWTSVHGVVSLELGGYLIPPHDAGECFDSVIASLMVGNGDTTEAVAESRARAQERLRARGFEWRASEVEE